MWKEVHLHRRHHDQHGEPHQVQALWHRRGGGVGIKDGGEEKDKSANGLFYGGHDHASGGEVAMQSVR